MNFKKCSLCKQQHNKNSLKEFRKNDYLSLGLIFVCKVCESKVDEYQIQSKDNYVLNSLRYKNKIQHGIESTKELLEIQLLNIKLKREIKNVRKNK